MLRRSSAATSQLQLCLLAASSPTCTSTAALHGSSRTFFGNLSKAWGGNSSNKSADGSANTSNTNGSSGAASPGGDSAVPPGFPPGLNAQQLQTMQQLFNSQPKDKQEQLLKQAMEMQKMMSKIPGMGKFTQKQSAMLEQLMKMQGQPQPQSATQTASSSAAAPSSSAPRRDLFQNATTGSSTSANQQQPRGGPSLDDLKKVNLGPEIEALFGELRTIRARKNEYRDKYHKAQSSLESLQKEHAELTTREANLRTKLAKAEQDVMLLTSENMELRDSSKAVKQLSQVNKQLKQEVSQLKSSAQASSAPGSASYVKLQHQLQEKEDALRSLQRKVDRMRRRDPLLQFSLACSDVSRLCTAVRTDDSTTGSASSPAAASASSAGAGAGATAAATALHEAGQEAADRAFADLQDTYHARQQEAWQAAAHAHGAAASAYVAVVRRYVMTRVPHANYDAVVAFTGDLAALRAAFAELGFSVEAVAGESDKVHVVAAEEAEPLVTAPGPYGYAFALRVAGAAAAAAAARSGSPSTGSSYTITSARPFVSATLVQNSKRSAVHYETARASGPGGQATNVTETQVYARLTIDGVPAYTAEAQDSRSALSNKEAALDKLRHHRRQQYNDTLARQEKAEAVQAQLVADMHSQGGFAVEEALLTMVKEAAAAQQITMGDAALVSMVNTLGREASTNGSGAQ